MAAGRPAALKVSVPPCPTAAGLNTSAGRAHRGEHSCEARTMPRDRTVTGSSSPVVTHSSLLH
eukprot:7750790-Alexandrium_andersonii.AAC.1